MHVPTTLFPSTPEHETLPCAVAHEVERDAEESGAAATDAPAALSLDQDEITTRWASFRKARQRHLQATSAANDAMARQRRILVVSAADADAEALEDPNAWRQWGAICERQGVDSLS